MDKKIIGKKLMAIFAGAFVANQWGILIPMIFLLMFLMVMDYISGMLAAKKEAIEHPNNKRYGWSSKKGILGIYKKIGYILSVFVMMCVDFLIYKIANEIGLDFNSKTYFAVLVTVWIILNEMLSIMENVGRLGVKLPKFVCRILIDLKDEIEKKED